MDVDGQNRVSFESFEGIFEPQIHIAEEVGNVLEVDKMCGICLIRLLLKCDIYTSLQIGEVMKATFDIQLGAVRAERSRVSEAFLEVCSFYQWKEFFEQSKSPISPLVFLLFHQQESRITFKIIVTRMIRLHHRVLP